MLLPVSRIRDGVKMSWAPFSICRRSAVRKLSTALFSNIFAVSFKFRSYLSHRSIHEIMVMLELLLSTVRSEDLTTAEQSIINDNTMSCSPRNLDLGVFFFFAI